MKKAEFVAAMKDYAKKYGEVVVQTINRTGYEYTGLMIRKNGVPTPVVNIDAIFDDYLSGEASLDDCYGVIDHILPRKQDFDKSTVMDWSKAKDRLFLRVFGRVSEGTIYREVTNLYLVPYIQVDNKGAALVRVTPQLLQLWKVSEDEVFAIAKENQETFRPAEITNLAEQLGMPEADALVPIYVVSTKGACGASAIFYEGVVDTLYEKFGEEFYILPSSIHEVLVIPRSAAPSTKDLENMVATVNADEVDEDERLTNSIYTYDFAAREFQVVSA